jgi:hypothetical protein
MPSISGKGLVMSYDPHESARWSIEANQAAGEYLEARSKVLADAGARGFVTPPGESLSDLLSLGMKVKGKLSEQNGKLYEEERQRIYELIEFNLKIEVAAQKLVMQWQVAELLDAIVEEQANLSVQKEYNQADIEEFRATVEQRQANIIRAKADAEVEVNAGRLALSNAQKAGLQAQILLVNAELATALAKEEIVNSVYAVIDAENEILTAEQSKVTALQGLTTAKENLVIAKQSLVTAEQNKATATNNLAKATIEDVNRQIQISDAEVEQAGSKIEIANLQNNIANAKKLIADDEVKIAQHRVNIAIYEKAIAKAREDLASAEQELAAAATDYAKAIGKVAEVEAAVEIARIKAQKDVADERKRVVDLYTDDLTQDIANAAEARAAAIAAEDGATITSKTYKHAIYETYIKA